MLRKVALVTGSNRGIGLEIIKAFITPGPTHFHGDIILTARKESSGKEAVNKLDPNNRENVVVQQLDVTSKESIGRLRDFVKEKYGRLDILVNNAGIFVPPKSAEPTEKELEPVNTNYFGIVNVCDAFFPLLQQHSRVVYMGAGYGNKGIKDCTGQVQSDLMSEQLTLDRLHEIMNDFIKYGREKTLKDHGYCTFPYGISKAGVHWLAVLHQRELDKRNMDIVANACCPGWVATDMGGPSAPSTPQEGADTPVYLSLLPPNVNEPRGRYLRKRKVLKWPDMKA